LAEGAVLGELEVLGDQSGSSLEERSEELSRLKNRLYGILQIKRIIRVIRVFRAAKPVPERDFLARISRMARIDSGAAKVKGF
jgi:hypothetical protein